MLVRFLRLLHIFIFCIFSSLIIFGLMEYLRKIYRLSIYSLEDLSFYEFLIYWPHGPPVPVDIFTLHEWRTVSIKILQPFKYQ